MSDISDISEVRSIMDQALGKESTEEASAPAPEQIDEVLEDEKENDIPEEKTSEEADEEAVQKERQEEIGQETYTPSELAEAVGWEPEELYNAVRVPMDDGQEPIPLGELKNAHQDLMRENRKLRAEAEKQAIQPAPAAMSSELMQANVYLQSIYAESNNIDWAELEELDPAEAALKMQKFSQAENNAKNQIARLDQQQQMQRQNDLAEANTKMLELIPSWTDSRARQADFNVIQERMKSAGFNENEIKGIADPRVMEMLKELIDLRAEKSAATSAINKIRKAPNVLGGRAPAKEDPGKQLDRAVSKAKSTGKKSDEFNAVKALFADRSRKLANR